jgi:hypothetical protein
MAVQNEFIASVTLQIAERKKLLCAVAERGFLGNTVDSELV